MSLVLSPTQLGERVYHDAGEVHLDRAVLEAAPDHGGVVVHVTPLAGHGHPLAVVGPHAGVVRRNLICAPKYIHRINVNFEGVAIVLWLLGN